MTAFKCSQAKNVKGRYKITNWPETESRTTAPRHLAASQTQMAFELVNELRQRHVAGKLLQERDAFWLVTR